MTLLRRYIRSVIDLGPNTWQGWAAAVGSMVVWCVLMGYLVARTDIDTGDAAIFTWTILQVGLTVRYGIWSRWSSTIPGRILFTSFCCTSIALAQVSVTLLTDSGYWGRDAIRPLAYTLGILGTIVMIHLLLRMQRKDREQ